MADGSGLPRKKPVNKLLAGLQQQDGIRHRLSSTEAGQYCRVIIQRLPQHVKELQKHILENKEVQAHMTEEQLRKITANLQSIIRLLYEQMKLVDAEKKAPSIMEIPENSSKAGILMVMKMLLITLPTHIKKLGTEFSAVSLNDKKDSLNWDQMDNPVNLDRIDDLIKDNTTLLLFHKRMLPVDAMRGLKV